MDFKTQDNADGGDATNNQAGGEIAAEIAITIGIKNEVNTSSTPKPRYIPIPPKTNGRISRKQNGRNNKPHVPPPVLPNNAAPDPH